MTDRCPRCDSPQPHLHPAVQHEGEVQLCDHPWHASTEQGRRALMLSDAVKSDARKAADSVPPAKCKSKASSAIESARQK